MTHLNTAANLLLPLRPLARRLLPVCVLAGGVLLGGCAGSNGAKLDKLKERLAELAQHNAKRDKLLESMSNRMFLLEDKVDTSRVAIARRQRRNVRLPVVRIRPEDGQEPAHRSAPAHEARRPPARHQGQPGTIRLSGQGSGGRSMVAAQDVEYSGAAAKQGGPRPVLRLRGPSGGHAPAGGAGRGPAIDPSTVKEKIPVVPMPKRKLARAMARGKAAKLPLASVAAKKGLRSNKAMRVYTQAMSTYKSGRYSAAAKVFRSFVGRYTKHAYADNALYWLGECFYDLKNYRVAAKMFRRVVEEYPNGNKAPAALLKLGFSYLKLQEKRNAKTVLAQVVEIFPRTGVARLASRELSRLKVQ